MGASGVAVVVVITFNVVVGDLVVVVITFNVVVGDVVVVVITFNVVVGDVVVVFDVVVAIDDVVSACEN